MQIVQIERYDTENRKFDIVTFRNNNGDALVIEAFETTKRRTEILPNNSSTVPMNGRWDLEPHQYQGYDEALARVKGSIYMLDKLSDKPDADILS